MKNTDHFEHKCEKKHNNKTFPYQLDKKTNFANTKTSLLNISLPKMNGPQKIEKQR